MGYHPIMAKRYTDMFWTRQVSNQCSIVNILHGPKMYRFEVWAWDYLTSRHTDRLQSCLFPPYYGRGHNNSSCV